MSRWVIVSLLVLGALFVVSAFATLALGMPEPASLSALVYVSPYTQQVDVGGVVTSSVSVMNVSNLYGCSVVVAFDKDKLEVLRLVDGGFLTDGFGIRQFDNATGVITYVYTLLNPSPPASGSGDLARIGMRAKAPGRSGIDLISVLLVSPQGNPIPQAEPRSGEVIVTGQAATSTPSSTSVATATPSATRTATPMPSITATSTPLPTATRTATATSSPGPTATRTATASPTRSRTATGAPTATPTPSRTPTATNTLSATPSRTLTATGSPTPTRTLTPTSTLTGTPGPTLTSTPSPTATATGSPGPTATATATGTPPSGKFRMVPLIVRSVGYETEPNDYQFQAQGPLESRASYRGILSNSSDYDWYWILVDRPGPMDIFLEVPQTGDYDIYLYLPDAQPTGYVAYSARYGNGVNEQIHFYAPIAMRYYILVYPFSGANPQARYALRVDY